MARIARCGSVVVCACAALLGASRRSHRHHSFAVHDFSQQIPSDGIVQTLNFKNPRTSMTLTRALEDDENETIHFVEGAPAEMAVLGALRLEMIKPGTKITAIGSPRRDDPKALFLRRVMLEDGREFL